AKSAAGAADGTAVRLSQESVLPCRAKRAYLLSIERAPSWNFILFVTRFLICPLWWGTQHNLAMQERSWLSP
ncbi:hypothetical protein ACCT20_36930, partial [Rhizobium ruizarguesonis]